MEINTKPHDSELKKEAIIHFPEGLVGFEHIKNFKLFNSETEKNLFWLKAVDDEAIEFTVTDPSVFQVNYEVTLNDEEIKLLDAQNSADIILLVTLSQKEQPDTGKNALHANFMGPIIINAEKKLGIQKTLNNKEKGVVITVKE